MQCEMPLTHTITDARLIGWDPVRLLPVMIGRMTISLKKVASSQRSSMSMGVSTGLPMNLQDIYSPHPVGGIQLSVLKS